MASASRSNIKVKKGSKILVKVVEWKALNFKLVSAVAESPDPHRSQSQILPKVLLINKI